MDGMRRSVQVTERLAMTASRSWRAASGAQGELAGELVQRGPSR